MFQTLRRQAQPSYPRKDQATPPLRARPLHRPPAQRCTHQSLLHVCPRQPRPLRQLRAPPTSLADFSLKWAVLSKIIASGLRTNALQGLFKMIQAPHLRVTRLTLWRSLPPALHPRLGHHGVAYLTPRGAVMRSLSLATGNRSLHIYSTVIVLGHRQTLWMRGRDI